MSNNQIATEVQIKFAFYFVALVFTVLALAVQTAKFGVSAVADISELVAWAALLISGVAGLSRLELMPFLYGVDAMEAETDENKKAKRSALGKLQESCTFRFAIHKYLFVFGLLCLIVARGLPPFSALVPCAA